MHRAGVGRRGNLLSAQTLEDLWSLHTERLVLTVAGLCYRICHQDQLAFHKESLSFQVPQIGQKPWVRTLWWWSFSSLGLPKLWRKLERVLFRDRII